MKRMHLSADNVYRDCNAASEETCTAKGSNGEKATHKYFDDDEDVKKWSEDSQAQEFGTVATLRKGDEIVPRDNNEIDVIDTFGDYSVIRKSGPMGNGSQWVFGFKNGYGASVIQTEYSYGGKQGLYELAVLRDDSIVYDTPITDDVLGYLSQEEVLKVLKDIDELRND